MERPQRKKKRSAQSIKRSMSARALPPVPPANSPVYLQVFSAEELEDDVLKTGGQDWGHMYDSDTESSEGAEITQSYFEVDVSRAQENGLDGIYDYDVTSGEGVKTIQSDLSQEQEDQSDEIYDVDVGGNDQVTGPTQPHLPTGFSVERDDDFHEVYDSSATGSDVMDTTAGSPLRVGGEPVCDTPLSRLLVEYNLPLAVTLTEDYKGTGGDVGLKKDETLLLHCLRREKQTIKCELEGGQWTLISTDTDRRYDVLSNDEDRVFSGTGAVIRSKPLLKALRVTKMNPGANSSDCQGDICVGALLKISHVDTFRTDPLLIGTCNGYPFKIPQSVTSYEYSTVLSEEPLILSEIVNKYELPIRVREVATKTVYKLLECIEELSFIATRGGGSQLVLSIPITSKIAVRRHDNTDVDKFLKDMLPALYPLIKYSTGNVVDLDSAVSMADVNCREEECKEARPSLQLQGSLQDQLAQRLAEMSRETGSLESQPETKPSRGGKPKMSVKPRVNDAPPSYSEQGQPGSVTKTSLPGKKFPPHNIESRSTPLSMRKASSESDGTGLTRSSWRPGESSTHEAAGPRRVSLPETLDPQQATPVHVSPAGSPDTPIAHKDKQCPHTPVHVSPKRSPDTPIVHKGKPSSSIREWVTLSHELQSTQETAKLTTEEPRKLKQNLPEQKGIGRPGFRLQDANTNVVIEFLQMHKFEQFVESFTRERVNGELLCSLELSELHEDLGMPRIQAKRLLQVIKKTMNN